MANATEALSHPVVVFSKNYLPINQINTKRAITLLLSGRAEPLEFPNSKFTPVRSITHVLLVPQHIRLTNSHAEQRWRIPSVTRREVLRRDKHACQYCGSNKQLTLDHVIPLSKGGKHSWINVVTACQRCNNRKGDRTPQQAGMILQNEPKTPMHPLVAFAGQFWSGHKKFLEE